MPTDLRHITTFQDLLDYLRDELDWPVEDYPLEDLTFEYDADELGLKDEEAEKLKEGSIRQLRPLPGGQPFGIFFVEFGQAKLPVVVLRRILNALVLKKRSSANSADRQRWDASDLLFISSFGEEDEREIAFAHFHKDPDTTELPVLRVLGWHGETPTLKTEYVEEVLKSRLSWPVDPTDREAWRETWSRAFKNRLGHEIRTAKELAQVLAAFAGRVREAARTVMKYESETGKMRQLHNGFKEALIHDLSEEDFATYYAETICYGLFTVAVSKTELSEGKYGTAVTTEDVARFVPITNPFLQKILWSFLDAGGRAKNLNFDDLGINEIVTFLNGKETDLPAVIRDFGNSRPGDDPVIHLYEDFLKQFDAQLRKKRGVYYTPKPVVSYIVRSVHELLQTEFGLEDGLASTATWGEMVESNPELKLPLLTDLPEETRTISPDEPFVQILDPATGTATFLVEVIEIIFQTLQAKWKAMGWHTKRREEAWNEYVPTHLLPRLHGYELMMAPYAIAHMKIGLKLAETGYKFGAQERAHVYLTNALEPKVTQLPAIGFEALAHEAEAVNEVKWYKRFTVVIGNPPYANYSANLTPEARLIVDKYRKFRNVTIKERNQLQFERNIQEDCVKFISIAQDFIANSGVGVLSYITNGTMLASSSLRGMRESLSRQFKKLFELNIHGGGNELLDENRHDENVFDIVQSVAIHIYVNISGSENSEVYYADLSGRRTYKFDILDSQTALSTEWEVIHPDTENCCFTQQDEESGEIYCRLNSSFLQFGAGIKTNNDSVVIGFEEADLIEKIRTEYPRLASRAISRKFVHPLLYRPFDVRKIFYHKDLVASQSLPTMRHMIAGPNIGIICSSTWTTPDRFSVGVSRLLVEMKTGSHDRGTTFFPFYRYESMMDSTAEKVHNFTPKFVKEWCAATQTQLVEHGHGDCVETTGPDDIMFWLYGLFHSRTYRRRYRSALSQGFPIILLASNRGLFREVSQLGGKLIDLHLLESHTLDKHITEFIGDNHQVTKVGWTSDNGGTVWLDGTGTKANFKPGSSGFRPVPEDVWNFHIGGYQVCEKWLKDRGPKKGNPGRTLSEEDITHYHKIIIALSETIRLMAEIDEVIEVHGGWPDAFNTRSGM